MLVLLGASSSTPCLAERWGDHCSSCVGDISKSKRFGVVSISPGWADVAQQLCGCWKVSHPPETAKPRMWLLHSSRHAQGCSSSGGDTPVTAWAVEGWRWPGRRGQSQSISWGQGCSAVRDGRNLYLRSRHACKMLPGMDLIHFNVT